MNKNNPRITLKLKCVECNKVFYITVYKKDIKRYEEGDLVQVAFPYLTTGERELIVSGICEKCFDKIFMEEE
jgi:hypothetical protein